MIQDKIKTRDELAVICEQLRTEGRKIGFTSGSFDLLHAGHVDYLERARALCDCLIVAVNSDESVKRYKGNNRPLNLQDHRIHVIAGLESVDYVFVFHERRNKQNIAAIKPDFYFKAGDYKAEQLTSGELVESYGGRVVLIPLKFDISTSGLIEKMNAGGTTYREDDENVGHFDRRQSKSTPAIFLDRDGTINRDVSYLHEPEQFELLPGVLDGLRRFRRMGYKLIIITNQGGIGLGYFTKEEFYRVNRYMLMQFGQNEIMIDKIYFCPHSLAEKCECRKPGTLLIHRAKDDMNIDLQHSYFIGDSWVDIAAGHAAGMQTILVHYGKSVDTSHFPVQPDVQVETMIQAADYILEQERA